MVDCWIQSRPRQPISKCEPSSSSSGQSFFRCFLIAQFLSRIATAELLRTQRISSIQERSKYATPFHSSAFLCRPPLYHHRKLDVCKIEEKKDVSISMSGEDINDENYKSWSTASADATAHFHQGSEGRKARLHQALLKIGLDPGELLESSDFQSCTAALRTYSSFIIPKSEGALAMAEQPKRVEVVANSIAFLIKEYKSHQEEWLRNHDKALEEIDAGERNPITLILDNVRSAPNVGNILRAAEAAKCKSVFLCGSMTPSPPHPKILKTAMGAAEYVPYEKVGSTLQAIKALKERNVKVIGVETTSKSIPLWKSSFYEKDYDEQVAFVFGNEMIGVDVACLEECDELIALPTHGVKNSLNVATCVSVVIWEALRQWEVLHANDAADE